MTDTFLLRDVHRDKLLEREMRNGWAGCYCLVYSPLYDDHPNAISMPVLWKKIVISAAVWYPTSSGPRLLAKPTIMYLWPAAAAVAADGV